MDIDKIKQDLVSLVKSRHTLLWITTTEEARVERALADVGQVVGAEPLYWDAAYGLKTLTGSSVGDGYVPAIGPIPQGVLDYVAAVQKRAIIVLRDFHISLQRDAVAARALRTLARELQRAPKANARTVVILSPSDDVPLELRSAITKIAWPLPDRESLGRLLADVVGTLRGATPVETDALQSAALPDGADAVVSAALGLSADEAMNAFSKSLVSQQGRILAAQVTAEKKRVVARGRGVSWEDPDPRGLASVGGLEVLKDWLIQRKAAFAAEAREYGLPAPRGLFLVGPPGTGKSLVSKCVASAWGLPLITMDLGAMQSKYVGESQTNLRQALALLEAVAPCVVRVDEIEKAMAGATGQAGDGGVAADALGTFLAWMQERKAPVFVIATANDVRALPPELLRKGRFDEVFFVDLPNEEEREGVLRATLEKLPRPELGAAVDVRLVASFTDGFSGAELAGLVPEALFVAFSDGKRPLKTKDLLDAAKTTVPVSKSAAERITSLREWAKARARNASKPCSWGQPAQTEGRDLEIEVSR